MWTCLVLPHHKDFQMIYITYSWNSWEGKKICEIFPKGSPWWSGEIQCVIVVLCEPTNFNEQERWASLKFMSFGGKTEIPAYPYEDGWWKEIMDGNKRDIFIWARSSSKSPHVCCVTYSIFNSPTTRAQIDNRQYRKRVALIALFSLVDVSDTSRK